MSRGAVGGEVAYLLLRHSFVAIIVGIEGAEGAVTFGSELFGRFIDRKFEVGDERRIVPGLPHLIVVAGFRVSGQGKEQAEGTCHANEQEIEPVIDMEFELHGRCSEKVCGANVRINRGKSKTPTVLTNHGSVFVVRRRSSGGITVRLWLICADPMP